MVTRAALIAFVGLAAGATVTLPLLLTGATAGTDVVSLTSRICLPSKNPMAKMMTPQTTRIVIEVGPEIIQTCRRGRLSASMTPRIGAPSRCLREGTPLMSASVGELLQRGLNLFGVIQMRLKDWSRAFKQALELCIFRVRNQSLIHRSKHFFVIRNLVIDVSLIKGGTAQSFEFCRLFVGCCFQTSAGRAFFRRQVQLLGQSSGLVVDRSVISHHQLGEILHFGICRFFGGEFASINIDGVCRHGDHRDLGIGWRRGGFFLGAKSNGSREGAPSESEQYRFNHDVPPSEWLRVYLATEALSARASFTIKDGDHKS